MSNWRAQFEDESGAGALLAWLGSYYHVLTLAVLVVFTLWNRGKSWGNYVVDGQILFPGNDPWYHYRATSYAVEHFPNNIPFDPWTYFSYGTSSSQFGTIFDQTAALASLVLGLGSPSDELVRQVLLFTPVVLGTAILLPAYLLGRRFGGSRFTGLASATIVALSTGVLLRRSVVGFADHHVAEALLQATAVLAMVVALAAAEREKPVYELFLQRNFDALRGSLGWGALAGIATGLYIWVWPPGILLIGILGVFFLLYLNAEYLRGHSPEHLAIVGAVAMVTTGVMNLATVSELAFRATGNSLLQPAMAFGLVAWLALVSWQARIWDERGLTRYAYPLAQAGVIAVGVIVAMVGFPTLFDRMFRQVAKVLGFVFPQAAAVGTVGETEPLRFSELGELTQWYGFGGFLAVGGVVLVLLRQLTDDTGRTDLVLAAFWIALLAVTVVFGFVGLAIGIGLAGLAGIILRFFVDRRARPGEFLLVVWIAVVFAATLTQRRFAYYLAVPMATLAVIPIGRATSALGRMRTDDRGVEGYQVLAVATVVLLVVAPMFAFSGANARNDPIQGSVGGPGGDIQGWEDSLSWMAENTPAEGTYGSPDGDQLEFAGSFPRQDDFDYGSGSYGVVSWWDYGHWITSVGERIPNANPFQQGARNAARFLLARSENEARDALARVEENDAKTRYATIDWKMVETMSFRPVRGKFFAPGTFHPNYSSYNVWTGNEFVEPVAIRSQTRAGLPQIYRHKQAYYESMAVRLYRYHGSAQEPRNFVVDWGLTQQKVDVNDDGTRDRRVNIAPRNGPLLRQFDNRSAAEAFVEEDGTAQIGGIGPYPSERVPALQHYRLVQASDRLADQTSRRFGIGTLHAIQAANVTDLLAQQPGYGQLPQQQLGSLAFNWLHPSSTAWTKVFERVPGAEIRGQGPPNSTVTAAVQMQIPTPKPATNFTYTQQAETGPDGEFTMTVPYSTTGYDEWGPENGQTNVSVRATGPYEFRTGLERQPDGNLTYHGGILEVSEAAVIGETDEPLTVTLEEQQPEPARNITVGNQTDGAAGEGGDGAGSDGAGSESLAASPVADGTGTEDGSTESALRDLLAPALRAVAPVARGGA